MSNKDGNMRANLRKFPPELDSKNINIINI